MYNTLLYNTPICDFVDGTSVWILLTNVFCFVVPLQSMAQVFPTDRQLPVNEE